MTAAGRPSPNRTARWRSAALLLVALVPCVAAASQPLPAPDCTVDARLTEADGLRVSVHYGCRTTGPLSFEATDPRTAPHVRGLQVRHAAGEAEADYVIDLGALATAEGSGYAVARDGGVLAELGAWLLEPRGFDRLPTIDIRVAASPGLTFASGLVAAGDAWRLAGSSVGQAGYTALGRFAYREVAVPAPGSLRPGAPPATASLRIALLPGVATPRQEAVFDWVVRTALAQAAFWQGFTVDRVLVGLVPDARSGMGPGRAQSGGGATVAVAIDRQPDVRRLFDSWVLTHELIHTAMPYLRPRGHWMMEGAATYLEPVIHARAGWKTEEDVWREWVDEMPRGVAAFARGLGTTTGRETYWAGALFMLMADLALRRETDGAKGLEDCLGAVLWGGVGATDRMTVAAYAGAADRACANKVLSGLVDRYANRGEAVDLGRLWQDLGVERRGDRIVFDDQAPLARWRRMIVRPGPVSFPYRP